MQLEGESGRRLIALFNNAIGPSLFLKADVQHRNCTWAACRGGSARTGVACAGASATVSVQDDDGIYRSGLSIVANCYGYWVSLLTCSTRSSSGYYSSSHAALPPPIVFGLGSSSQVKLRTANHVNLTSHVTRHTSHVTRHTSYVTRHTSHANCFS